MLAAAEDRTVRLWNLRTGKVDLQLKALAEPVGQAGFAPDGRRFLTAGRTNGKIKIWDAATGKEVLALAGMAQPFLGAGWSRNGQQVFALVLVKTLPQNRLKGGWEPFSCPLLSIFTLGMFDLFMGLAQLGSDPAVYVPVVQVWDARTGRYLGWLDARAPM